MNYYEHWLHKTLEQIKKKTHTNKQTKKRNENKQTKLTHKKITASIVYPGIKNRIDLFVTQV